MAEFVRFQSAVPNRHGRHPGVFAMANGLGMDRMLTPEDQLWLRAANDAANAAYVDPSAVAPDCYDATANPGARSWFKTDAATLLGMTRDYLALLDRYGIAWVELRTSQPGRIVYEDGVQVVAVGKSQSVDAPPG